MAKNWTQSAPGRATFGDVKTWLKVALAVVVIWGVAIGIISYARSLRPTQQSIAAYIQKNDLASRSLADRAKVIHKVGEMLNQLPLEERQAMRPGTTDEFFRALTPDEQTAFLDETLPTGFKQMMEAFNKMEPEKRKRFVEGALKEMQKHQGEAVPPVDDQNVKRIVDQGLRSFYTDASADVKLDLAPLIEQMQVNLQGGVR